MPRRGDLIRVWYSDDVTVEANTTVGGRDVVLWYSNHLTIRDNRVSGGRYGLHFMYCHDASVSGNLLRDNSVGAFLMYSERLRLRENWIATNRGVSGYGIGLKDMDDCHISGNVLAGNKVGIFLEHSRGAFVDNLLADNDKGIVIFPSAMGNRFEANTFLDNGEQVVIEGFAKTMTTNTWRGNFWSDYRGYDARWRRHGRSRIPPGRGSSSDSPTETPRCGCLPIVRRPRPSISPRGCSRSSSRSRSLLTTVRSCDLCRRPSRLPASVTRGTGRSWGRAPVLAARPGRHPDRPRTQSFLRTLGRVTEKSRHRTGGEDVPSIAPRSRTDAGNLRAWTHQAVRQGDRGGRSELRGADRARLSHSGAQMERARRQSSGACSAFSRVKGRRTVLGEPCGPRGRASRRLLGYVPQEVRLHADQSVRETVRFYARLAQGRVRPQSTD